MQKYRELINTLNNCVSACEFCANSCLDEDNVEEMTNCIRLDRDCADICSLAIKFLSRESKRAIHIIGTCADFCAECAEECEKHDHDHCIECAKACRQCEESCKAYLNQ